MYQTQGGTSDKNHSLNKYNTGGASTEQYIVKMSFLPTKAASTSYCSESRSEMLFIWHDLTDEVVLILSYNFILFGVWRLVNHTILMAWIP